jgi:hypothetical protein
MRSSEELFRRSQILRDQLSELTLLRRRVLRAEKRAKDIRSEAVSVRTVSRKFETVRHSMMQR